jgi:hypothetical protein
LSTNKVQTPPAGAALGRQRKNRGRGPALPENREVKSRPTERRVSRGLSGGRAGRPQEQRQFRRAARRLVSRGNAGRGSRRSVRVAWRESWDRARLIRTSSRVRARHIRRNGRRRDKFLPWARGNYGMQSRELGEKESKRGKAKSERGWESQGESHGTHSKGGRHKIKGKSAHKVRGQRCLLRSNSKAEMRRQGAGATT